MEESTRYCVVVTTLVLLLFETRPAVSASLGDINLPEGFRIEYYTQSVPKARSLALSTNRAAHILYVSTRELNKIYAVVDSDADGTVDNAFTILDGYSVPNGIAYRDGALYLAQVNR
eukprot:6370449-Pyramimonas_sp.AAC.2